MEKEIEIIEGDLTDLEISPVYDHLKDVKIKSKEEEKKENIIIPNKQKEEEE